MWLFRYMLRNDRDSNVSTSALIWVGVVVSCALKFVVDALRRCCLFQWIPESYPFYQIVLCALGLVLGWLCAITSTRSWFVRLRRRLGVHRTVHSNIWDDINAPDVWMRVWVPDSPAQASYLGQIQFIEEHERNPIVVLYRYQYIDGDGNILTDYSDAPNNSVVLNLNNFDRVEIYGQPQQK